MGERERALEELEHAVTLDVEDINAHLQKVGALPSLFTYWCVVSQNV